MKRKFKRRSKDKAGLWRRVKYGVVAAGVLGLAYMIAHTKIEIDPSFYIERQKTKQVKIDKEPEQESALELAIEKEFGFDLRLPPGYDPNNLKKFRNNLREIKKINPGLVICAGGSDIYVLPDSMRPLVDYEARCCSVKWMEFFSSNISSIKAIGHEFNHNFTGIMGDDFFIGWKKIVKECGFEYEKNFTPSKGWIDFKYHSEEPQGVFPRSSASNLSKDKTKLPLEHTAVIHEHMYTNKPFIANSRKAYNCYLKLFEYAFDNGMLTQPEYEQALRLLSPESILEPGNTQEDIAKEWGASWEEIAQVNGIISELKKPIKIVIPTSEEAVEGLETIFHKLIRHRVKKGECLSKIAQHYRRENSIATVDYIIKQNNNLFRNQEYPEKDTFLITDRDLIREGSIIKFAVPVDGLLFKERTKWVPYLTSPSCSNGIMYGTINNRRY